MDIFHVFISYAHESPDFRGSVKDLAQWLQENSNGKIVVTTDHKFPYKAPPQGWQVWMHTQIVDSEVVLIICTPKYSKRFIKREDPDVGKGAIHEGAIITTLLYEEQTYNDKFIPIIPDDGSGKNVPNILKPFFNYLSFPSKNDEILKAILNDDSIVAEEKIDKPSEITLENEIVNEIIATQPIKKTAMFSSIHVLVRAFLKLGAAQKISISKMLSVYEDSFLNMLPDERDKAILKKINERNLISDLWEAVNRTSPFEIKVNPFKKN